MSPLHHIRQRLFGGPEGRLGASDVSRLSRISVLSFDSIYLFALLLFCLSLLFLSSPFCSLHPDMTFVVNWALQTIIYLSISFCLSLLPTFQNVFKLFLEIGFLFYCPCFCFQSLTCKKYKIDDLESVCVCVCVPCKRFFGNYSIKVVVRVTSSDMRMHHVLIILTFTFIQGHIFLNR